MDYTALDLCLWENGLNCVFKSGETVCVEEQNILHTTVLQVVEHSEPEFTGLIRSYGNTENILVVFHGNSRYNISSTAEDPAIFTDFIMDAVHENEQIYRGSGRDGHSFTSGRILSVILLAISAESLIP